MKLIKMSQLSIRQSLKAYTTISWRLKWYRKQVTRIHQHLRCSKWAHLSLKAKHSISILKGKNFWKVKAISIKVYRIFSFRNSTWIQVMVHKSLFSTIMYLYPFTKIELSQKILLMFKIFWTRMSWRFNIAWIRKVIQQ